MRFALISDVHFGPAASFGGKLRKLTHEAERLTSAFVHEMNTRHRPDFVVNLGDVIEDESREADLSNYRRFLTLLSALDAPVLHVAGNHDTAYLSDVELRSLWQGEGPLYYSLDRDGFHLIVLHTLETKDVAVRIPDAELEWLARDLAATRLPTLVFMHHPASEMNLEGNRWFERAPHICRVAERRKLRKVLEDSGKIVAVFNGHVHWNHFDLIRGIPYVTLQSLIENVDDDAPGRAAAAHAVCDVDEHRLLVTVYGEQPVRYQFER